MKRLFPILLAAVACALEPDGAGRLFEIAGAFGAPTAEALRAEWAVEA